MNVQQIKQALISRSGIMSVCHVVEHDQKIWLVPEWVRCTDPKQVRPKRMIRIDTLEHSKPTAAAGGRYVLNNPIPKELFDDQIPPAIAREYEIRELPQEPVIDTQVGL